MNTKHTPGPWHVEHPFQEEGIYITCSETTELVAKIYPSPNAESYAKLIAAAPELLEALQALLNTASVGDIERLGKAEFAAHGQIFKNYQKVLDARAAIAKATE